MAVGVILGAAFGKIVSSAVGDLLMPPLGLLMGGMDFSRFEWVLQEAAGDGKPVALRYGAFLTAVIDFAIVAFAVFLLVRGMNRLRRAEPAAPPAARKCPECRLEIPSDARRCGHCTAALT